MLKINDKPMSNVIIYIWHLLLDNIWYHTQPVK